MPAVQTTPTAPWINLDRIAAIYAQKMVTEAAAANNVETLERLVTKTLGVLQEQGVYAMMLFLFSRTGPEQSVAPSIRKHLFRLLRDEEEDHTLPGFDHAPPDNKEAAEALDFYTQHVLQRLDTLLLVRDLYEQTLIYARYGAKAAKPSDTQSPQAEQAAPPSPETS